MITIMAASVCLALAAKSYNVSKSSIDAVLSAPAATGSVGPMHIPLLWLPILSHVGFVSDRVMHDRCTNIEAGTWILAYEALRPTGGSPQGVPEIRAPSLPPNSTASDTTSSNNACEIKAARFYHIPVALLDAVLRTEGGHVGQIHQNNNGSYDMGPAQINSIWLPVLARSGITRAMVLNDGCLNIGIGAWVLAQSMAGTSPRDPAAFWRHVGDYNSHTPFWNRQYALKVWNNLR